MASFRGGSAEAVAALTEELESVLSSSDAAAVGAELFGVAATLRSEGALRRFATDGSVPAEGKAGVVGELFRGKVSDGTMTLLTSAVGRRWTATRDLPDALEQLGVVAQVRSAGRETGRLADELFAVAQAVKDNAEFRDALSDPARSKEDKARLLRTLLEGKALPATLALAEQALAGSYRTVSAALADYQKIAAEVHGRNVATVRVARPLSDGEAERLADALSSQYGRPVHLNLVVDPRLLGGIRVEIGDDVIDGTVASRLDDARRRLAG